MKPTLRNSNDFVKLKFKRLINTQRKLYIALFIVVLIIYSSSLLLDFEFFNYKTYPYFNITSLNIQTQNDVNSGCVIPQTPIMPSYFQDKWARNGKLAQEKYECTYEKQLAEFTDNEQTLHILPDVSTETEKCCIQEIQRGNMDSEYSLTPCQQIEGKIPLADTEAFIVKCSDSINFDAAIPTKTSVQKKIDKWADIPPAERPMSVLFFGFDSMSRKHAQRSLPKSVAFMTKMGFVDFESYHSIQPSTLTNFMGFLMGLTRQKVRVTCAPDWTTPFDTCPIIWKNFHENNYVTSYVEDGSQTFNWGGQSGFVKQPTDYYLHHLFRAASSIRENQVQIFKNLPLDCASNETMATLVLRYTQRIVQKFADVPLFAFTWFANPFHDDIYTLQNYDDALFNFFQSILSNKDVLQRTMIIFLSDHGDRTNFFNGNSIESFFERGLPPLFIRIPDIFAQKYPQILESIKLNSKFLTTPFDVHHTLLHALSLVSSKNDDSNTRDTEEGDKVFTPRLEDRSSLFVPLNVSRTCSDTNIPATRCLCNAEYINKNDDKAATVGKNGFQITNSFLRKILKFSISQLNLNIQMSKYRDDCHSWTSSSIWCITYSRKIIQTSDFVNVLLAFDANPGEAKFEATIKIRLDSNHDYSTENFQLMGFSRVNEYRNQSWCVDSKTDADKEMKEICMCKDKSESALASISSTIKRFFSVC